VRRPRTLYVRLALSLLGLLVLLGVALGAVTGVAADLYQQEVAQRLNRDLAATIVGQSLPIRDGAVDREALDDIFHSLMLVNPRIEIYLLDRDGAILAFSAPAERVVRRRVNLAPVRRFLAGGAGGPIVGDDPRSTTRRKVFSAAAIPAGADPAGYLYVVLQSEQYAGVAQLLGSSYVLRLAALAAGLAALATLGAGLLVFRRLTRRIRRLSSAMEGFEQSEFTIHHVLPSPPPAAADEIDHLVDVFNRLADRNVRQMQRLRESDALRRELVANVSHDLRTPLASLRGYLETLRLKDEALSAAERREYLDVAERQSRRLGRLVGELFELAKLDARETRPEREPFAVGELLQDLAQKFRLPAARRGVRIETALSAGAPSVWADIGLIERVLENLIDNAIRHAGAGGEIRLSARPATGTVEVRVSDTGGGIPPEALPRIFDRHHQVDDPHDDRTGRAGLGLAIAKRILELHGSAIEATSAPGAGTTFAFALPVPPAVTNS